MFSSFGHARNPSQNTRFQTQHLTPNPFEHPVLGFQMASTCYAERSLPEMAGYASQMPKQNDGSLHSSSRLVRKDTCSAVGYWETSAFCLKILPIWFVWFAVSSFKSQHNFSWKILNRMVSPTKIRGLSPAAASGNCFTLCSLESLACQIRATCEST